LKQIAHVGVSPSVGLKLISGEIIFEVFQLNVTDKLTDRLMVRGTDRQTTYCGITALCIASRGEMQG